MLTKIYKEMFRWTCPISASAISLNVLSANMRAFPQLELNQIWRPSDFNSATRALFLENILGILDQNQIRNLLGLDLQYNKISFNKRPIIPGDSFKCHRFFVDQTVP